MHSIGGSPGNSDAQLLRGRRMNLGQVGLKTHPAIRKMKPSLLNFGLGLAEDEIWAVCDSSVRHLNCEFSRGKVQLPVEGDIVTNWHW